MSVCPRGCGQHLLMAERQGVQIDYCPQCRGIWLDHGELEKIVSREAGETPAAMKQQLDPLMPPPGAEPRDRYRREDWDDDDDDYRVDPRTGKRRKKEGFFDSIMDIFD